MARSVDVGVFGHLDSDVRAFVLRSAPIGSFRCGRRSRRQDARLHGYSDPRLFSGACFHGGAHGAKPSGKVLVAVLDLVLANIINWALNGYWVAGWWGGTSQGVVGSAKATAVSRAFLFIFLLGYAIWVFYRKKKPELAPRLAYFKKILRTGVPSATQMSLEVGVFTLATAFAARLAPFELAAHHIALNTASLTFMVPLGLGSSAAVFVGKEMGANRRERAFETGWRILWIGTAFMTTAALTLVIFRWSIAGLYSHDIGVQEVAANILLLAALFQIFDGAQTVTTGALRGLGDTRSSAIANFIGHWWIGLPLGYVMAFVMQWRLLGLWVGLSSGLIAVSVALLVRWWGLWRRNQAR